MPVDRVGGRVLFFSLVVLGFALTANGDEERARVTIRGTGNDVSIDRTGPPIAPLKKPELSRRSAPPSVLSEAIHMKEAKASDELVISFLRENASRLPIVVDLDTLTHLRQAGAGKSVIRYLASVSAIEVGESGAVGGGPAVESPSRSEPQEESGSAVQYGYPVFGGYSLPPRNGRLHFFRRPEAHRFQPAPVPLHRIPPSPSQRPEMNRESWGVSPRR